MRGKREKRLLSLKAYAMMMHQVVMKGQAMTLLIHAQHTQTVTLSTGMCLMRRDRQISDRMRKSVKCEMKTKKKIFQALDSHTDSLPVLSLSLSLSLSPLSDCRHRWHTDSEAEGGKLDTQTHDLIGKHTHTQILT